MKVSDWLILIMSSCLFGCVIDQLKLILNPAYAIGTVDYYSYGGGNGVSSHIHFHYGVNGTNYSSGYDDGDNGWNVPWTCGNCKNGNMFMVQYDSLQAPTGRMLFSYQVADSLGYKKYLLQFKKTPPGYPSP